MVSWLALVAPSARTSEAGRLAFSIVVLCYTAFHSTCVIQRYSNCLPKRKMVSTLTSCDVDHVLIWTRLSVRISAVGSKVMRKYCARRTGTRLCRSTVQRAKRKRVHRLSVSTRKLPQRACATPTFSDRTTLQYGSSEAHFDTL